MCWHQAELFKDLKQVWHDVSYLLGLGIHNCEIMHLSVHYQSVVWWSSLRSRDFHWCLVCSNVWATSSGDKRLVHVWGGKWMVVVIPWMSVHMFIFPKTCEPNSTLIWEMLRTIWYCYLFHGLNDPDGSHLNSASKRNGTCRNYIFSSKILRFLVYSLIITCCKV